MFTIADCDLFWSSTHCAEPETTCMQEIELVQQQEIMQG